MAVVNTKEREIAALKSRIDALYAEIESAKQPPAIDWPAMVGKLVMVRDLDRQDWMGPVMMSGYNPGDEYAFKTPSSMWSQATPYTGPTPINWIEWSGGECPVEDDVVVLAELRNGEYFTGSDLDWSHDGDPGDILRYAVLAV